MSNINFRNQSYSGKNAFLPPKCPLPSFTPSYGEYGSAGPKGVPKPREGYKHHQRTSSESFLIEEQPSWLDDLLNEPETPVKRGAHRRSSSDSFAYFDANSVHSSADSRAQGYNHQAIGSTPKWDAQGYDHHKDAQWANRYTEVKSGGWDTSMINYRSSPPLPKDKGLHTGFSYALNEPDSGASKDSEKLELEDSSLDLTGVLERMEGPHSKQPQSETDTKRVKQQFAQRSRVRKLQYIAELEKNVQALQAEGMEVSAELEFIDQQNIILNMENQTLKQRLDNLTQEHRIKKLQQEMLEREIARLRLLFQQQQQHQQSPQRSSTHNRSNSRDLESQFKNLSLKHKEPNSGQDPVTGALRI